MSRLSEYVNSGRAAAGRSRYVDSAPGYGINDREVEEIIKKLRKLTDEFNKKDLKKIAVKAGKPMMAAMKANITPSEKPHKRYDQQGNVVATYYPGNLKRSIRRLSIKAGAFAYYGPKIDKKPTTGKVYKGNAIDGWYGNMVEYGLSRYGKSKSFGFARKAFDSTKEVVKNNLIKSLTDKLNEYKAKYERPISDI